MQQKRQPTFTMLVGLPRSGKSTWITENPDAGVVVSNDWIREEILGTHYSDKANAIIWSIADATLRIVLGQGKDAVLDGVNLTKFTRSFYIKLAREYGARILMVVFETPVEVCLKRNVDKKLPDDVLSKMSESYQPPTMDEYDYIDFVYNHTKERGL